MQEVLENLTILPPTSSQIMLYPDPNLGLDSAVARYTVPYARELIMCACSKAGYCAYAVCFFLLFNMTAVLYARVLIVHSCFSARHCAVTLLFLWLPNMTAVLYVGNLVVHSLSC